MNALESEQAAIGAAMMGDAVAVTAIMATLRPWHFHWPANQTVLRGIGWAYQSASNNPAKVDFVTVAEELKRRGTIDECGGTAYLKACIEGCPSSANVDAYIRHILESARRRAFLIFSAQVAKASSAKIYTAAQMLAAGRATIDAIEVARKEPNFTALLDMDGYP